MRLTRKVTKANGTLREYQHQKCGKLTVLSYTDGVLLVWNERGWDYPASLSARERRIAELERLTRSPKKRRRKAGAEPAKARRTG